MQLPARLARRYRPEGGLSMSALDPDALPTAFEPPWHALAAITVRLAGEGSTVWMQDYRHRG